MEHIIKQLKKGAKHTRLSVSEKTEMKSALLRHVKMNPVRNENLSRHYSPKANVILSPFQINNLRNKKTMPLLIMLGLLMGGSASFAAENTVPGDVLYPVKIHVNETVRGAIAVSPKAKAEWDVHLVGRRLEEVEKLAVMPNALPEARQIAQTNLAQYTERVKEHIAKFDDENDSEDALATAGDLADMLRTYEGVLAGLSAQAVGTSATSTVTAIATSTATTTVADTSVASAQSLASVLTQLRSDRGDAEKKHKDLERKYHPEVQSAEEDKMDNGSDEAKETKRARFTTTPAPSAFVGTSTATTQTVVPGVSSWNQESTSGSNDHEEIRAAVGAVSTASTTTSAVVDPATTVHIESHTEPSKTSETTKSHDSD